MKMTNDLSRSRKRRASPVSKKDCACWPPPCSSPSPPSQAQRRSPWTCPTLQETTTTGANRHWAEARVQRNRWPILKKPARKVACGRLVPALPRNHARHFPRTSVPIFRHARKVACGRLVPALPRPHPRSRRPTLPRPHRPPAAPGHDFASQEFDCTGGLGSGDSELAVATVKKAPAGGKKRAKKAKPFSTPSTLARATCHTREKPWPDYGHLQNPDGTHGSPAMACDADLKIDPANGHLSLFIAPVTSHDAPCFTFEANWDPLVPSFCTSNFFGKWVGTLSASGLSASGSELFRQVGRNKWVGTLSASGSELFRQVGRNSCGKWVGALVGSGSVLWEVVRAVIH
jgi:hypothetical protein